MSVRAGDFRPRAPRCARARRRSAGRAAASAASALAVVVLASATARAQAVSTAGFVSATLGAAVSQLKHAGIPAPTPAVGPFLGAAAGATLTYDRPSVTHKLAYDLNVVLPLSVSLMIGNRAITFTNRLNYTALVPLDPLTTLSLGLNGNVSPIITGVLAQDASLASLEVTPAQLGYNFIFGGLENLTRELTPDSRVTQATTVSYDIPTAVGSVIVKTLTMFNTLAAARTWSEGTGTVLATAGYTHFTVGQVAGASKVLNARSLFHNSLKVGWERPLSPVWTAAADIGISEAFDASTPKQQLWQPTGDARLTYAIDVAQASLLYTYDVLVAPLTATLGYTHMVSLRGSLPFGETGFSTIGSAGVSYGHPIAGTTKTGALVFWLADLGLRYVPPPLPNLSFSLRGLASTQLLTDDPRAGLRRLSATLSVTFSFPSVQSADAVNTFFPSVYTPAPILGEGLDRADDRPLPSQAPGGDAPATDSSYSAPKRP